MLWFRTQNDLWFGFTEFPIWNWNSTIWKNGVSLFFKDFALYHCEVYLKKVNWVGSSTFLCLQLWTTLSIWIISSDHSGWFSTWTTWFLVELWEPLGDWTCSCVLSSQGLKVFNFPSLSVIYPNEMFSFVVLVWGAYDVISSSIFLSETSTCC